MSANGSKRMLIRLVPQDHATLGVVQQITGCASKSGVAKDAVALLDSLWRYRLQGFRIVLRHVEQERQFELSLRAVARRVPETTADADSGESHSDTLEVRVSLALRGLIDGLVSAGVAANRSDVVRKALSLYSQVVSHCQDGWQLAAVSPAT